MLFGEGEGEGGSQQGGGVGGRNQIDAMDGYMVIVRLLHSTRITALHHEQELLAFAIDADDMDICDAAQGAQGSHDVEHGRELDEGVGGMAAQLFLEGADVGRAILDEGNLAACGIATCGIATCGVDEQDGACCNGLPRQDVLRLAADDLRCGQSHEWQVMAHDGTEVCVTLDINGTAEERCQGHEVDAEAAGEVNKIDNGQWTMDNGQLFKEVALVEGGGFAGTLLQTEARGIKDAVSGSQQGKLTGGQLTAFYLCQRFTQVDIRRHTA